MEKQITVWIGAVLLLLAALNCSDAQVIPTYFEVGGTLDLRPTVTETITNILWKYNGNLLAEWVKDEVELFYYDKYQNRTTLNTATGQLVVKNMVKDDVGSYTVEINNKVHGQSYNVKWITRVTKPTVVFRPLTCGQESESCSVICDGQEAESLSDAEPIEYSWKIGEKNWEMIKKEIIVTRAETETGPIETISCRMKNPVSEEDSELTVNLMYREPPTPPTPVGPIVGGIFGVLLVAVVGVGIGVWKLKPELLPGRKRQSEIGIDFESGDKGIGQQRVPDKDLNNSPEAEHNNTSKAQPNNSTEAPPNNSTEAPPNNSTEAPPNNSTEAPPNNSTEAKPNNSPEAQPNNSPEAEPNDPTEAEPINPSDTATESTALL